MIKEKPKQEEVKKEKQKAKYVPTLTDEKIKKLLDFAHLEELFHLLNLLDDKQVASFIEHYKNEDIRHTEDKRVDRVMRSAKTPHELRESAKNELAKSLTDEYEKIRGKISQLRKKGSDLYIEDMRSLSTPSKITMFASTGEKDDFYKVKKLLQELQQEVDKVTQTSETKKTEEETKKNKEVPLPEKKEDDAKVPSRLQTKSEEKPMTQRAKKRKAVRKDDGKH